MITQTLENTQPEQTTLFVNTPKQPHISTAEKLGARDYVFARLDNSPVIYRKLRFEKLEQR